MRMSVMIDKTVMIGVTRLRKGVLVKKKSSDAPKYQWNNQGLLEFVFRINLFVTMMKFGIVLMVSS